MIRALVVLLFLGGAAAGAVYYVRGATGEKGDVVPTYVVARGELVRTVTAEGNLRAVKATPLSAKGTNRSGPKKIAWLAPDGQPVKKGDVVVRFDPTDPEKKLRDSQSDLDSARARLQAEQIKSKAAIEARDTAAMLAAKELEQTRQFQSKDEEIFSRHQIMNAEIEEELAGAKKEHAEGTKQVERKLSRSKTGLIAVEQQKAQLAISHAKAALESMEIRAPHDGLFILQRNWKGELVKVGDQLWPSQTIAEIPLLDAMEAEVFVLEVDGSGLAEKQPAELVIEARPGITYKGKVRLVDKLAKPRFDDVPVQYFAVVIELDKTDRATMKPGQRVRATIKLDEANALLVPRQAILNKDGKNYVYRRTPRGEFEQVPVELGAATSGRVAVKSGLAEGDRIALRDPTRSLEQTLGSGEAQGAGGGTSQGAGAGDTP